MRLRSLVLAATTAATLLDCSPSAPGNVPFPSLGVDLESIDTAIKPGDDFFRYANGQWLDTFEIPADRPSYGTPQLLYETAEKNVQAIVEELSQCQPPAGTTERKVADFFSSWMNSEQLEARGLEPLAPFLEEIDAAERPDLVRFTGTIHYSAPFGFSIIPDPADPTRYTLTIGQSGLGMPNRDYYLQQGERFDAHRTAYKGYIGRIMQLLDSLIGEGLGEIYVDRYFPATNKAAMDDLVDNLLEAFQFRLENLTWMDDETRAAALQKLATFEPRIGHPSSWRDYTALDVTAETLFENVRRAREFEWQRKVSRLDQPVDRNEWAMNPQTVNAYYNPLMNQITFPAAILQPPVFRVDADPAVNYAGIGSIIGHEIGHGFDDQGRKFDESGTIRDWWTATTQEQFERTTKQLADQYSGYCPLADACINGELTMGENIGDLGGLEMAYTAYRLSLDGEEAPGQWRRPQH